MDVEGEGWTGGLAVVVEDERREEGPRCWCGGLGACMGTYMLMLRVRGAKPASTLRASLRKTFSNVSIIFG